MSILKHMKNGVKVIVLIMVCCCWAQEFHAQSNSEYRIIRSNLGSSGSSKIVTTSNGTYQLSQSIGQSSVIGTHFNNGYYLRQGYQQLESNIKMISDLDVELKATVYPNPFNQGVFISFSELIRNDIFVKVFDINARHIHSQKFLPAQKIELHLGNISSGTYFLKVASDKKHFNTKLIKI